MRLAPLELLPALHVCRNLRAADIREIEATRWGSYSPEDLAIEVARVWTLNGYGWSVFGGDGLPVAFFGATQPWPGVFSAYMLATDDFPRVALPLTKFVKRVFIPYLRERGHRIEARSIDGHTQAHGWLRLLGAGVEARMQRYGRNGEDFLIFTLAVESAPASV